MRGATACRHAASEGLRVMGRGADFRVGRAALLAFRAWWEIQALGQGMRFREGHGIDQA